MKNILSKIKSDKNIVLSFFLPILIFLVYFILYKMHYKDFFVADLHEQYSNFFYYYKDVLNGNASIFYSFYKGLGGSMLGTFIYYLSSPLNLLLIFVPKHHIQIFMVMLIFFKIALSSTTMYIYLKHHFKEKINLIFPLCYAISGYIIMYYFNIMWLDVVYLSPLVLLGIDKIIENEDIKYYMIFLFLTIISNIYISFMLCIFSCLYFFYQYFLLEIKDKRKILLFFKSSLITGLLCSLIIIPFAVELSNVYRVGKGMPNSFTIIIKNFFEMFSSFFLKLPDKQMAYWNPNVYFSIFMFVLVILYFFNKNIHKRNKKISFIFIILFILSYSIPFINYIWHGFSNTIIYGYRYSFLITIFLIFLSYESFKNIKFINKRDLLICFIITIFFYLLSSLYLHKLNNLIIINLFFIVSYFLFINIHRKYNNKYYMLCLSFMVILELFINIKVTFITNKNLEKTFNVYDEKYGLCERLGKLNVFRIEGEVFNTDENLICGYGKISEFNTMNDKKVDLFLKYFGIDIFSSYIRNHVEISKILNSILNIDYIYSKEDISDFYELVDTFYIKNQKYYLYKNNSLNIGFTFKEKKYQLYYKNNFEYQNTFIKKMTGIDIYQPCDISKVNKNTFLININNDSPVYLNYKNRYDMDIYVNNKKLNINKHEENELDYKNGNIYIPNIYENQKVTLKLDTEENINEKELLVYYLDMNKFNKVMDILSKEQLNNIKIYKNKLEGNIKVDNNKSLFLSIPYSNNFIVYVDNQKVKYRKLFDTFLGIDLKKGNHNIKIIYFPKYIFYGIFLSSITLEYCLLKMYKKYKKTNNNSKKV